MRLKEVLGPAELAARVRELTASPAEWVTRVRLDPEGRWYEQIHVDGRYEIWLISWLPGQSTGFHDHGRSSGAFGTVWGALDEHLPPPPPPPPAAPVRPADSGKARFDTTLCGSNRYSPESGGDAVRRVSAGVVRSFGPRYVHDVRNTSSSSVAVSVHAYSPPLSEMTRYSLTTSGGLAVAGTEGMADW